MSYSYSDSLPAFHFYDFEPHVMLILTYTNPVGFTISDDFRKNCRFYKILLTIWFTAIRACHQPI